MHCGLHAEQSSKIQFNMDPQGMAISQVQVQLLRSPGSTLVDHKNPSQNLFPDNKVLSFITELHGVGLKRIKTFQPDANSALRSFYFCILKEMFSLRYYSQTLMRRFKTLLYSEHTKLDLVTKIKGLETLTSRQMKKLIVQFLHLVTYSREGSRVEMCLDRYPVIDRIMLVFMRTLLIGRINRAENYGQELDPFYCFQSLSSIFKIDVSVTDGYFQLFDSAYHVILDRQSIHLVYFQDKIVQSICSSPAMSPLYDIYDLTSQQSLSSIRRHVFDSNTPCFDQLTPCSSHRQFSFRQQENSIFDRYAQQNATFFLKEHNDAVFEKIEELDNQQKELSEISEVSQKKRRTSLVDDKFVIEPEMTEVPSKITETTIEKPISPTKASIHGSDLTESSKHNERHPVNRVYFQQITQRFDSSDFEQTENARTKSVIIRSQPNINEKAKEQPFKKLSQFREIQSNPQVIINSNAKPKTADDNSAALKSKFRISFQYKSVAYPLVFSPKQQPSFRTSYESNCSPKTLQLIRNNLAHVNERKGSVQIPPAPPSRPPIIEPDDRNRLVIPYVSDTYTRNVSRSPRSPKQALEKREQPKTSFLFPRKLLTPEPQTPNRVPQRYQFIRR